MKIHARKRTSSKKTANELKQICSQAVDKLCLYCLFQVVGTSCQQLITSLMGLSDLLQGCSIKTDIVMLLLHCYSLVLTTLCQCCSMSISNCYDNLVTSLIFPSSLSVASCYQNLLTTWGKPCEQNVLVASS